MYTEENEFNYNDYLDEDNGYNNKNNKHFIDFKYLIKLVLIILLIILIIFLVFKIRNKNLKENNKDKNNETINNSALVLTNNLSLIRDASRAYFFQKNNLPNNVGEESSVNVKKLIEEELVISVKDENGDVCGYNTSGSTIKRNREDYELVVNVNCATVRDEKTFYYNLEGNCLTCNGESYTPSSSEPVVKENETKKQEENIVDDYSIPRKDSEVKDSSGNIVNNNTQKEITNESNTNVEDNQKTFEIKEEIDNIDTETTVETKKVCNDKFSSWTTKEKNDSNLEVETRTLVKGYKTTKEYGSWSKATTNKITPSKNLQVKSYTKDVVTTSKTCSNETKTKPASKEGRTITSRVVTKNTTKRVCTGGGTYTKTLTKWDNNAISCKSSGIGKVVCTYKSPKKCTSKPVTSKVTYYKYCDTVKKTTTKTYYQSRTIDTFTKYTDYMLESKLPSGYKVLKGSEKIQYRYREKCDK